MQPLDFVYVVLPLGSIVVLLVSYVLLSESRKERQEKKIKRAVEKLTKEKSVKEQAFKSQQEELNKLRETKAIDNDTYERLSTLVRMNEKNLEETISNLQKRLPDKTIFVITSCPAGIIGDDVASIINKLNTEKQHVFHVTSDGVLGGDFSSGVVNAYKLIAKEFIDTTVCPQKDTVNLIGEQTLATTADQNFIAINQIINALGVKINCRFVRHTSLTEIKNFKKAKINIPFNHDPMVLDLTNYLNTEFNTETLDVPIPIAFEETSEFIRAVAKRFGKESRAEEVIKEAKTCYDLQIAPLKTFFAGKKALIFNSYGSNIDWLLSTLLDLGVDIVKVCVSNLFYPKQRDSLKYTNLKFETNYPIDKYGEAVSETCPDFVLTAGSIDMVANVPCDTFPVTPTYGFYSGLEYAKKLQLKLQIPFREGWRQDEQLF